MKLSELLIIIFICGVLFAITANAGKGGISTLPDAVKSDPYWTSSVEGHKPVILYFYGNYCGACRSFKPYINQAAAESSHLYTFIPVDVEDEKTRPLARNFSFRYIPSLFLVDPKTGNYKKIKCYADIEVLKKEFIDFIGEN